MLDLLIKLILALCLQFGYTEKGQIQMNESDLNTLKSSEVYKSAGSPSVEDIVVVPNIDPNALDDIVVVPNIDPTAKD